MLARNAVASIGWLANALTTSPRNWGLPSQNEFRVFPWNVPADQYSIECLSEANRRLAWGAEILVLWLSDVPRAHFPHRQLRRRQFFCRRLIVQLYGTSAILMIPFSRR